jgi:two-component system sensor histidine kinase AlgZ
MQSIKENLPKPRLPDFCNLGTWLRVLLAANGLALAAVVAANRQPGTLVGELAETAAIAEPVVLGSLVLLCLGHRIPLRVPSLLAAAVAVTAVGLVGYTVSILMAPMIGWSWQPTGWSVLAALLLLCYFDLTARARSPAVTEARLQALTARIRPHFLFNSINAVLGVIRADPRRAETALEELSDLFRALMKDNRDLVPLSEEIALVRQYVALEKLRLGDRLSVRWEVESCPPDAIVPPLMLQPLVENAVYHGIELLDGPGEVRIRLAGKKERLHIEVANPVAAGHHHAGNHMALGNIRERLRLFFDLEAELASTVRDGIYVVSIDLPYRKESP